MAFGVLALPLPIYLVMLLVSLDPYEETAYATGQWKAGSEALQVSNIMAARDGAGHHIMRFDFAGDVEGATSGTCRRREYRYDGMHDVVEIRQAAHWWPAETLQLNLLGDKWPMYECVYEGGISYSMTVSPEGRVYLWRGDGAE